MQEFQQFARRIGLIGAANLLISLSGLILLPILTKTLPIEEYGTYVQITVTIGLVPGVVMLGLPYTMVRYLTDQAKVMYLRLNEINYQTRVIKYV